MSGQASHSIPIYKVASPVVQSTGNGTSTTTTTVTVTSSTSTTPRMLLPAVLIPGKDGSGPSFAQFIPAAGASKNIQQGSSSTNIQPFIISGMPAGTSHHQASSSMLGLLTPVLPPDKSHKSKTIMHTTKLNSSQAATVVHAVLPQKQKIKFFSTKGPLTATSIMDESKKKSISSPPPLQPISAQHQIISLNKLKHLGGLNQFKRIQPYPTPAVEPSPSTSNDQSVLRVQIKQGNFGEFRSYAGKLKDSPEKEKKIFKEKSPAAIAKEAMAKIKDNDSMLTATVNEFPGLIAIPVHPGLTPQRPSTSISETITIHSLASQKSTAEIPLSPEAITLHPLATQKSAPESLLKTETITLRPIAPKKSVSESVLKTETITLVPIATPSAGCDSLLQNEAFTIHPLTIQKKTPGSLLKTETIKLCNTSVIEEPISEPLLDNEALSLHPLETQLSGTDFQSEDITILPITQKLVPECSLQSETITLHPLTAPNTLPDILMENETIIQSPSPPQENSDKIIQRDTAKASTCELNATTVNDIKSENDLEQNSKVINEEMPILPSTPTPIPVTVPEIPPVLSPSVEKPKEETPVPETPQVEDTKNPAEIEKEDTKATDATDKPSEETDSNKSEEEFNYKKMRQFKRPSILGGRKKFFDHGSPILASTLKKTAIAAFTKTSDTPEMKKETLEVKKETPEVKKEENEDKKESSEAVEEKPQNASSEVKPPVIEEKVADDFDPTKVLDWQDGVGVLPGSNLKFKMNEFGIMEMVEMEEDSKDAEPQKSESLPIKTEVKCEETQEEKKPPVPEVRKRARKEKLSPDDIYCCENCGCYGMACEFKTQRFCSDTCEEATSKRRAAIGRRAMELEELKQKRRKKRQLDVHGKPKTAQESGDDTASSTPEVPGMLPDSQDFVVNTPVTSATPGSTAQNSPSQTPAGSDEEANLSEGESSKIMDDGHANKKPRRQLTIQTKVQILFEVEKKELSKAAIARKYHIPFSSLATIVSSRERIFNKYYSSATSNCRVYKAKYEQVEFKLFELVTEYHKKNMKLNGPILQQEAQKVALEMGFTEFKCSNGWLSNFKRRFRHFVSIHSLPKENEDDEELNEEKDSLEDVQKWIDKHCDTKQTKQEDSVDAGPSFEEFSHRNLSEESPAKISDDNSSVITSVEDFKPSEPSVENLSHKDVVKNASIKNIDKNLPLKDKVKNLPIKDLVKDLPIKNLFIGESGENVPLLPWQVVNSNGEALFSWPKYLEHLKARAAPTKLFPDGGFPYQRNGFRPGMRLEGIDPRMPSQFCALSIADVKGYRIKLHFEGWPDTNDFWINADSRDIFAVAFCEKSGRSLVPPRGYPKTTFTWTPYLKLLKATAAPRQLFLHRPTTKNAVGPSGFRVGMKLEAVDKQNQELICVATVAGILDGRLLVHFDSWDHTYDYWVEPASPYIHPVGWCEQNKRTLTPPNGYTEFDWDNYLKETKSSAVPSRAFKPKSIAAFKKGMKLECVDPRFPELIRVSTVNDCRRHRIQISFDGWPLETAVWVDCDSPDIHPMGWCNKTGHLLTPPPGPNQEHYCITPGCRALLKNSQLILPHSCNSCPLSTVNLTNVNKVKKIPVKETIMAKPPVESSEGEDFKGDSDDDEDYIDEKPEPPPKKRKLDCNLKSLRLDVHESIFSPGYVPSPAELPLKWSKHAHLLNIENKKPLNNKVVKTWSPHQVQNFVSSLPGFEDNSKAFIDEKIDGESLLLLTQSDLISMLGFKVGPAIKLYSSITLLKNKKQEV